MQGDREGLLWPPPSVLPPIPLQGGRTERKLRLSKVEFPGSVWQR